MPDFAGLLKITSKMQSGALKFNFKGNVIFHLMFSVIDWVLKIPLFCWVSTNLFKKLKKTLGWIKIGCITILHYGKIQMDSEETKSGLLNGLRADEVHRNS